MVDTGFDVLKIHGLLPFNKPLSVRITMHNCIRFSLFRERIRFCLIWWEFLITTFHLLEFFITKFIIVLNGSCWGFNDRCNWNRLLLFNNFRLFFYHWFRVYRTLVFLSFLLFVLFLCLNWFTCFILHLWNLHILILLFNRNGILLFRIFIGKSRLLWFDRGFNWLFLLFLFLLG